MQGPSVDYTHPYLTKQIIAYIGNKRRLLPLIHGALRRCVADGPMEGRTFVDLFAGSGVVSRFAKYLGFQVTANDWEPYAYVINKAYLGIGMSDLAGMYREHGGIDGMIRFLNDLPDPGPGQRYVALHYSPSTDALEGLDHRRERMFYTRRNGLVIDRVRNTIEVLYPEDVVRLNPAKAREKDLLVSLLLYEAATHTNTSGVFKAYHKGFGGHGRDALGRILAPIRLPPPVLIDSEHRVRVFGIDANSLLSEELRNTRFDVAYLDPPYNQHQYGSNYHVLNTIALWDKPEVSNALNARGVLSEKAAIRRDWVNTKSDYCYREKAPYALEELLSHLDAGHVLLSYSTEGIVPFDEVVEICASRGKLDLVTDEYVKYRGGKQSIRRLNRNIEFVLIIDTRRKCTRRNMNALDDLLMKKRLSLLFQKRYSLGRLEKHFNVDRGTGTITPDGIPLAVRTIGFFELVPPPGLEKLRKDEILRLIEKLENSVCEDREEELSEILEKIRNGDSEGRALARYIPGTLRKLAHKKYREKFHAWLSRVKEIRLIDPAVYRSIEEQLARLEEVASRRFAD